MSRLSRRARWLLAGTATVGLVAGGAVSATASGPQPPPGASVDPEDVVVEPIPEQPPPGAEAAPGSLVVEPIPEQPPNPNPDLTGAPTEVVDPNEPNPTPAPPGSSHDVVTGVVSAPESPTG